LTFNYIGGDNTEIFLGSVDEALLRSDVGTALCKNTVHVWGENAVKGVSDKVVGTLYSQGRGSEEIGKD
jgi:hypothetical protein